MSAQKKVSRGNSADLLSADEALAFMGFESEKSIAAADGSKTECRSEFELEFLDRYMGRASDGRYEDQTTRAMWHAWQIAWCKTRAPAQVSEASKMCDELNALHNEACEQFQMPVTSRTHYGAASDMIAALQVALESATKAHERELLKEIDARDHNAEMADRLAEAIGRITGDDVGEHSSDNCPWAAALECADNYERTRP